MDLMRGIIFGGVCALVATFGSSGMNRDTSPMMQIFRPNIPRSDVAIIPDATTRSHKTDTSHLCLRNVSQKTDPAETAVVFCSMLL